MYNPNTGDNREYTLYSKYTGQVANTYHTRSAAETAQNAKEAEKDWSWRIRTIVIR